VREVLGVDYAVSAFLERGRRFWKGADCPTLCAKTSMASFPVIAALQPTFGINEDVADVPDYTKRPRVSASNRDGQ